MDNTIAINNIVDLLARYKKVFVLTGAGMSTDSGIPDFRGEGGLWSKIDPIECLSRTTFNENPQKFHKHFFEMYDGIKNATPNKGHYLLKEMEDLGIDIRIATQNIDGLHQKAGSEVLELHGNMRHAFCQECSKTHMLTHYRACVEGSGGEHLRCYCGGLMKPATVLFGDTLPGEFSTAMWFIDQYPITLAIGTTLSVYPVADLATLSSNLIIINKQPTPFDDIAVEVINDDITSTLAQIVSLLKQRLMER